MRVEVPTLDGTQREPSVTGEFSTMEAGYTTYDTELTSAEQDLASPRGSAAAVSMRTVEGGPPVATDTEFSTLGSLHGKRAAWAQPPNGGGGAAAAPASGGAASAIAAPIVSDAVPSFMTDASSRPLHGRQADHALAALEASDATLSGQCASRRH